MLMHLSNKFIFGNCNWSEFMFILFYKQIKYNWSLIQIPTVKFIKLFFFNLILDLKKFNCLS